MDASRLFRMTRIINRLLWPFLLPIIGGVWFFSRKSRPHFGERLGLRSHEEPDRTIPGETRGPRLLFHLASLGEAHAAIPLIDDLSKRHSLYLTTTTLTGRTALKRRFPEIPVSLAPLDLPDLWQPFLKSRRIAGILLFETEIWPIMILSACASGIPVGMVNGRLSSRGMKRMSRFGFVFGRLVGTMNPILVQSPVDRDRFIRLGAVPDRVVWTGNLKWDLPEHPEDPSLSRRLEEWLTAGENDFLSANGKPFRILFSSVHPGEAREMLEAILGRAGYSRPLHIILAPRHLDRMEEFRKVVSLFRASRFRSASGKPSLDATSPILLSVLDTYGELRMLPPLCEMAVIGGTVEPIGGHSPIEAAHAGIPLAIGPHVDHIRDLVLALEEGGGVLRIETSEELPDRIERLMGSEEECATLGERAKRVCEGQRGAHQRTLAGLRNFLERTVGNVEGQSS
ncbi:MAG: 3-deoxy-D-manno-octulosonic acid transferase [Leptospirillum sp.]